ncbi:galactose oxidase [Gymnopus androsaceus JB14]|uniref:Galactose oxidase n=1 Tax=Gymnopus androsaceus JB14 TaxID=1447944 RepID=A0A6A4HVM3_9AGAR|nr:galactose oxidase [Gymnopus androsaceus JB14]
MTVSFIFPLRQYWSQPYLTIGENCLESQGMWMEYLDILALGGNITQCYSKLGDHVQTIDWIQEVISMIVCQRQALKDTPSWKDYHLSLVEYWMFRIKSQLRGYTEFAALGNTGLAAAYAHVAVADYDRPDSAKYPKIAALEKDMDIAKMFAFRHPDPNQIDNVKIVCPEIQVQGTWERLELSSEAQGRRPRGRCAHSSWIWRSRLYICLGVADVGPPQMEVKDMWYLDLNTKTWTRLPDVPTTRLNAGLTSVRPIRVWRDKAYLFVGTQSLHVFDLVTERWSILKTTLPRGKVWPYYSSGTVKGFASTLFEGKFYVFGGEDGGNPLGQNIFMVLDLTANKWEHLSGSSENIPKTFEPNLRAVPCMWTAPNQRKIFIMYGSANRTQARYDNAAGAGEIDYTYDDFWSYHVDDKKWERERLRGSYPSPRTEAASAFSDGTGRAVVYGGYHGSMKTLDSETPWGSPGEIDRSGCFEFAVFGDTFVYNPESRIWQHVLVRGFPSYRAMATIACDPDTGKVYLFGGYTNSDFVPSKSIVGRVHNDVWMLKIDLPGGNWNAEDIQRDRRNEKMGPWMRCFTCGNCGITWQKCGGSCGGKYYFCSKECQKAGRDEHKEKQGCRKL